MIEVLKNLSYHRKELDMLKLRKQTTEEVLNKKSEAGCKQLNNYNEYIMDLYKRHYTCQKMENSRLRSQMQKVDKQRQGYEAKIIELEARLSEVEDILGNKMDASDDENDGNQHR